MIRLVHCLRWGRGLALVAASALAVVTALEQAAGCFDGLDRIGIDDLLTHAERHHLMRQAQIVFILGQLVDPLNHLAKVHRRLDQRPGSTAK